jgi:hypothetical protein
MSSEVLISDRSESNTDLESSKQWLSQEIDSLFRQPTDPAILERIRSEHHELERLSEKTLTELSGEEALRLISGQQLSDSEAPQLFDRWWKSIDLATQKEVNVAAEDFEDLTDYQRKCFTSSGGLVMNAAKETFGLRTLWAQLQAGMPKITEEQFTGLWIDAVRRRKVLKRGCERFIVKSFIDDYVGTTREVLNSTFGIAANRPTSDQNRDRYFSKRSYQGLTSGAIAREWNRDRRRSNHGVTPAAVAKAVTRYRNKREPVMWLLRLWIYRGNFPKLTSRTCPCCEGKGEIYFVDDWYAWYQRRLDRQDWRFVPEDDPEPPYPPPKRCELCDGTGIRSLDKER